MLCRSLSVNPRRTIGRVAAFHTELPIITNSRAFEINHGLDTRYPQEKTTAEYLERLQKNYRHKEYLSILQSNTISMPVKETLAKEIMYHEEDPCLALYLTAGGFYDGSGFDDDDLTVPRI